MDITHDDISARMSELDAEMLTLQRRHWKERESLVELCAGLGHQFEDGLHRVSRCCVVCQHSEWVIEDKPIGQYLSFQFVESGTIVRIPSVASAVE